jgi:hypothetical protein
VQQLVDREQELLRLREDYAEAQERMEQFVKAHQQVELARNERAEFAAVETTDLVTLLTLEHGVRDAQQQLLLARQQAKKPVDHLSKYSGIAAGAVIGSYAAYLAYQKWHGAAIFVWLGILLVLSAGVVVAWRVGWLQGDPDLGIPTVQQAMQQLEEAKRKRAVVFEAIGVTTVEETVTLRKTYEFKDRNMEKALAALQALGDEGEAEQRARELKLRVNQEQSIVEEMLETDVTLRMMGSPQKRAEQAAQLQAEVEKIETELEDRRRQQSAIERQLFFEGAEEKDVPALVQRITTVRQELIRLRRRVAALESAHETMARILGQDEGELDSLVGNA